MSYFLAIKGGEVAQVPFVCRFRVRLIGVTGGGLLDCPFPHSPGKFGFAWSFEGAPKDGMRCRQGKDGWHFSVAV